MAEAATKIPVKTEERAPTPAPALQARWPLETLRREVDRLFDDFGRGLWSLPFRRSTFAVGSFWRREWALGAEPAVDIAESDKAYEITAELPGMDEKEY
jgi:HSP20 family protein